MGENLFFDCPDKTEEQLKKSQQLKDAMFGKKGKTYADTKILESLGLGFDFEEEKKKVIDNLNHLKSLSVEEFTFLKKWEEIQEYKNDPAFMDFSRKTKASIWSPTDINDEELTIKEINNVKPRMVVVTPSIEQDWLSLRIFCHTAEHNQAPGRLIKFILIDENKNGGNVLGFSSIASEVIAISCRDEYLGWTLEDRLEHGMLNHSAIGTTIAATQPFGANFLGGKLIAAMMTSDVVRNQWYNDYENTTLVGMTTTSLYGPFSMYNSLKWWKPVGKSKGKIPIKSSEKSYETWHHWLKQHRAEEYNEKMTQKEGVSGPVTGAKMRVLSMIFDVVGVKQSDYVHGFERGVYYSSFYENTKDFLCRKITKDQLVMKPLFKSGDQAIIDWWKPKAIERYKKLKSENRLTNEKLFYNVMSDMSYEEAKQKFFSSVGK